MPYDSDSSNRSRLAGSQLSLGHLLLWITCCAICCAVARPLLEERLAVGPSQWFLLLAFAIFTGLCWTTVVLVICRWTMPAAADTEPGEWLLFCAGVGLAVDIAFQFLPELPVIHQAVVLAPARSLVLLIPTWSRRLARHWKTYFVVLVLMFAMPTAIILTDVLEAWPLHSVTAARFVEYWRGTASVVGLLGAGWAVMSDYRAGLGGSCLHWIGVVSTVVFWIAIAIAVFRF